MGESIQKSTQESIHEPTQALARFAATLRTETIPERVRTHCKHVLLDTIACAVAGHQGEETDQVAALASGLAQSSESTVIGGDRLSLAGATLLNGFLVTAVTMCDAHRPTLTHVTPEVVPAALAIAERDNRSGRHRSRTSCSTYCRHHGIVSLLALDPNLQPLTSNLRKNPQTLYHPDTW